MVSLGCYIQVSLGNFTFGYVRLGKVRLGQDWLGWVGLGQDKFGMLGKVSLGQVSLPRLG